jgi:hypothetical protein
MEIPETPNVPEPPSGRKPDGYGEIRIGVWLYKEEQGKPDAEVAIAAPDDMPFVYYMLGCEHMIRFTAQKSNAGYEKAIDLLVDGALKGKGRIQIK